MVTLLIRYHLCISYSATRFDKDYKKQDLKSILQLINNDTLIL